MGNLSRVGLCFRCEYRARFLETGSRPRYECGVVDTSTHSCYMYRPTAPLIIKKEDRRPLTLNLFSCRVNPVGIADGEYKMKKVGRKIIVYWEPK